MNEEFLQQVIAEVVAKQKAGDEQIETGIGTVLAILTLALSDQVDIEKLIGGIAHGADIAKKHGYLNTTAALLVSELVLALSEKQKANPHQGQAKH